MMVPPEGMSVAGVKASVTGTGDLPATRSDDVMLKNTEETAVVGAAVVGAAVILIGPNDSGPCEQHSLL